MMQKINNCRTANRSRYVARVCYRSPTNSSCRADENAHFHKSRIDTVSWSGTTCCTAFKQWLKRRAACISRSSPFCVNSHGRMNDESPISAMEGLVGLFVLLIAQLSTGSYLVQGRDVTRTEFVIFGLFSTITWVAMALLVGSARPSNTDKTILYVHDRGTVIVGKWLVFWSLALLIAFVTLGVSGNFPGTGARDLKVTFAGSYEEVYPEVETSDVPMIVVQIPISPHQFNGRIPEELALGVRATGETIEKWHIVQAQLYVTNPHGPKMKVLSYPDVDKGTNPPVVTFMPPEFDKEYVLEVYFEPDDARDEHGSVVEDIKGRLKAFKNDRTDAINDINELGAIELTRVRSRG